MVAQHGGQAGINGDIAAFHGVAIHDGGEGVERGVKAVVGVVAGGVEVGEAQRAVVEAVEVGRQILRVAEGTHEACRHRLHEHQHHVVALDGPFGRDAVGDGRYALYALAAQQLLHLTDGGAVVHQRQALALGAQFVQAGGQEGEHGVDTHVVEHGIGAEIGGRHLDGIVAEAAAYAQEAEQAGRHEAHGDDAALHPSGCGGRLRGGGHMGGSSLRLGGLGGAIALGHAAFQTLPHGVKGDVGRARQAAPQPAVHAPQQHDEGRGEGEEIEDVEVVGGLAEEHAGRGGGILGPVPHGGVEGL